MMGGAPFCAHWAGRAHVVASGGRVRGGTSGDTVSMEPDSEWCIIIAAVVMIITKPARTSSPERADQEQNRKGTSQSYEGPHGVYRVGSRPATERNEDER